MKFSDFAIQASKECATLAVHPGKNGSVPFWNIEATQFMYVPAFGFSAVPECKAYRFSATDESGKCYSFISDSADSTLLPIWDKLSEGNASLTVTALNDDGTDRANVGTRSFFKLAPFPEKTPEKACAYTECAKKAYEYTMKQSFVRHWLEHGTPDPCYDLNTYPSKITSSLIKAMIVYAELAPEHKEDAMKIAVTAADWLISITPRGEHPLANIPPTYYFDFCPDPVKYGIASSPNYELALRYGDTVMMIYPAEAGDMYLSLGKATGNKKYFDEALKIGKYYLDNVRENGSWYLVLSKTTGKPIAENYIAPMERVVPFILDLYELTGDEAWKCLADKAVAYTEKLQLESYNWEGQFEDTGTSANYNNLSQYGPVGLARYYAKYRRDDKKALETAIELMRFVEDQFVVWNRPSPARESFTGEAIETEVLKWTTPTGLEQYRCYCPIDASSSHVINGFLALYEAGCGDIYLAKARALANSITRVQHENGQIPTFWMHSPEAESNFWFNCMFYSCATLNAISKYDDVVFE